MIDIILHLLSHAFEDTWLTFPILLVTYIIIEIFERRPSDNDDRIFFLLQKSVQELHDGKGTAHELIEVDDE